MALTQSYIVTTEMQDIVISNQHPILDFSQSLCVIHTVSLDNYEDSKKYRLKNFDEPHIMLNKKEVSELIEGLTKMYESMK